jgi:hyaluronan synthase
MDVIPTTQWVGNRVRFVLATVTMTIGIVWLAHHVFSMISVATGHGNPLTTTYLFAFMLLWWVPLAWMERPFKATARQFRELERQVVSVSIPAYNEDPNALRMCIESLFTQTRLANRIHVVDDGSTQAYPAELRVWAETRADELGIELTWVRTVNRGKRHAQMEVLATDDADYFITLDSDSVLEPKAIEEGLKPFVDPKVYSVAGMVVVWNNRQNFLTLLTGMLYMPFTRGFRSAQSVLGRVMVNSGTLAFYRGETIRKYAGVYENEQFMGRPMQMNDDSLMTFYGMLDGKTVHQPTSVAFTLVPARMSHYLNQQRRWMRGTFIRTMWWLKYLSFKDTAFWMAASELVSIFLSLIMTGLMIAVGLGKISYIQDRSEFLITSGLVALLINYTIALRYFIIKRSDEPAWLAIATFALAPVAGLWRQVFLRPMMFYAYLTFWKVGNWGTREEIEVGAVAVEPAA